jgi:hypothetical protein
MQFDFGLKPFPLTINIVFFHACVDQALLDALGTDRVG